jgi:hypothetical protein
MRWHVILAAGDVYCGPGRRQGACALCAWLSNACVIVSLNPARPLLMPMMFGGTYATTRRAPRRVPTLRGKLQSQRQSTGSVDHVLQALTCALLTRCRSAVSAVLVKGGRGKSGVKKSKVSPLSRPLYVGVMQDGLRWLYLLRSAYAQAAAAAMRHSTCRRALLLCAKKTA